MARIFCIGRNYAEHARELANAVPTEPVVFMKPAESLVPAGGHVRFPAHGRELHHEVELVLRIGSEARDGAAGEELACVDGVSVGIDLTLRDVQATLKSKGLPWEAAKAFEQSALIGDFVPLAAVGDLREVAFWCDVNGERRQQGSSADMIFDAARLISHLGRIWTLRPGDLVYTGTPRGVGPLAPGDEIRAGAERIGTFSWRIED